MKSISAVDANRVLSSKQENFLKVRAKAFLSLVGDVAVAFLVIIIVSVFLSLLEGIIMSRSAHAAELKGYEAMLVSTSGTGTLTMKPGEVKSVAVQFQNIGSKDWSNDGASYISIYTYGPKYRSSVFDPGNWEWGDHPARIRETYVPVGSVATIMFDLYAPEQQGSYTETFHLAAEDTAWVPGGEFSLNIVVSEQEGSRERQENKSSEAGSDSAVNSNDQTQTEPTITVVNGYGATIVSRSADNLSVRAGEIVEYTVGIKNAGTKIWTKRRLQLPSINIASSSSDVFHVSWLTRSIPIARSGKIAPGEIDYMTFKFTAPQSKGNHIIRFQLVADNIEIPGGEIDIPVEVTSGAPDVIDSPRRSQVDRISIIPEPIVRVAVLIVDEETDWQVVIESESDIELRDDQGAILANVESGQEIVAFYKNNRYYYDVGRGLEKSTWPLRFIPTRENAVLEVTNFDRRRTRNASYPDNTFRNILELRYNSVKDRTWLINELPIEMYLRGLAETSNGSEMEFQKTLITAARTYAFYHWERQTKHDEEGYHIDAYWDQVYKGYGYEERTPNITKAVQATEGIIVTYDGNTAITPYFSRSDGRTRDWSEVWYGDVEWLKSVAVPCDKGKTLWGHGVGMSASGALCMAEDGDQFEDILKYFYQGIDLTKRW